MEGGAATCDPRFAFSEGGLVSPVELALITAQPLANRFGMFENNPNDEPVQTAQLILEIEYICYPSGSFPFCALAFAPGYWDVGDYAEVTFGGVDYQSELKEMEEGFVEIDGTDREFRRFTYTIPLSMSGPTSSGLQSEELRATIYNYGPNPLSVFYDFLTRVTVFGDEVLEDPEWTTQAPTLPHLILRDPPGDRSYAFLEENSTTCHGYGMSIGTDNSLETWASVRLGASGSLGLVAEVDYEVYAELSGGVREIGVARTTVKESKCVLETSTAYPKRMLKMVKWAMVVMFLSPLQPIMHTYLQDVHADENDPVPHLKSRMK